MKKPGLSPLPALRREWGLAPLCGAVVTSSHYSKGPSRPRGALGSLFIYALIP